MSAPPQMSMAGKIALVTGATGGVGKEIARGLARMGATVVIGARSPERGEATRTELAGEAGNGDVLVLATPLDVADQASVRAFAAALRTRFDALHLLVNNAGAWFTDRKESPDGYELTFATNVLGPYHLTNLLLDPLRAAGRAGDARVVNVVSALAEDYDATDLQYARRRFDGYKAYSQSKQALYMLTWDLAARLAGTGVTANAATPGFVRTDLNRQARGLRAAMIGFFARLMAVSPAEGADTPLWVATAPELQGVTGKYYSRRKEQPDRFREPGPIADLEQQCREMVAASAPPHDRARSS